MFLQGGVETHLHYSGISKAQSIRSTFCQKGSIVLQNDIWIGDNVTIMSGCTVRNGAVIGNKQEAVSCLLEAFHFIMARTYDTVYATCLADRFGIELISGVDTNVVFTTSGYNMIRE